MHELKKTQPPVIDVSALRNAQAPDSCVHEIGIACRNNGFFYISGHGISENLQMQLETLSRAFFALPIAEKMKIRMELGGRAWRGYFPPQSELTSGVPDLKEGIYFGSELSPLDPRVVQRTPMHGANLFPERVALRETVLEYMHQLTQLGHALMRGISLSLGLSADHFQDNYTRDPLTLFRIFHYPESTAQQQGQWGVGEHTDYGLLTILKQDNTGGLQIKSDASWIDAVPIENTFVCNIGDMLDRMTGGLYRSTAHRVLPAKRNRLSFPFFFDPGFDSRITPVRSATVDDQNSRWDKSSVHLFEGTYGEYLLSKVARVFPDLQSKVITRP